MNTGVSYFDHPEKFLLVNIIVALFNDHAVYGLIAVDSTEFFTINSYKTIVHNLKINVKFSRINYSYKFLANLVESSSINVFIHHLQIYDLNNFVHL